MKKIYKIGKQIDESSIMLNLSKKDTADIGVLSVCIADVEMLDGTKLSDKMVVDLKSELIIL